MRCLTKVIFINSANVPYAEIRLDGNVHFIGTQGVGKSTLLRAILFFYNGDKTKLGIPKEKKNFDDFYLPHSNSYHRVFARHIPGFVYEKAALPNSVDKAEARPSLTSKNEDAECSPFVGYLIDNI